MVHHRNTMDLWYQMLLRWAKIWDHEVLTFFHHAFCFILDLDIFVFSNTNRKSVLRLLSYLETEKKYNIARLSYSIGLFVVVVVQSHSFYIFSNFVLKFCMKLLNTLLQLFVLNLYATPPDRKWRHFQRQNGGYSRLEAPGL